MPQKFAANCSFDRTNLPSGYQTSTNSFCKADSLKQTEPPQAKRPRVEASADRKARALFRGKARGETVFVFRAMRGVYDPCGSSCSASCT